MSKEEKGKFDSISAATMREKAVENSSSIKKLLQNIESLASQGKVSLVIKEEDIDNDMKLILNGLGYAIYHNSPKEGEDLEFTITW